MRAVRFLATALCWLTASVLCFSPDGARAQTGGGRAALLVGNAAYPDSDSVLPTPVADARALGDELKKRGFSVEIAENVTKEALQAALERLARRVEPGSVAMLFFGGYGIQVAKKNYLIPVDARIWSEADVLRDGVSVDAILADLDKRGAGARVLVLDASRRNPFERRFRSFSTGLAAPKAALGTLSLYSAAAGSVLNDTAATRSLFVTELVKQIGLPDLTAEQAFGATRDAISKATRNLQTPTLVSNLDEVFSFDPNRPKPAPGAKRPAIETAEAVKPAPEPVPPPVVETKPVAVAPAPPPPVVEPPKPPQPKLAEARPAEPVPPARVEPAKPPVVEPEVLPSPNVVGTKPAAPEPPAKPAANADKPGQTVVLANKDQGSPPAAEDEAVRAFDAARTLGTKAAYLDFLSRHPSGSLAARARAEIARIEAAETPPASPWAEPSRPLSETERARKGALDQRIARNPRDAMAYYERGQFYAQRGDSKQAIVDFDQTVRLDPANAEALNNRCWMRAVVNELQLALADCNQALKLRQGYVDALDSRGFVNLKLGAFQAAISDYDAALRLDAAHGSALYGRGVARRRLGQTAQAEKDFASALQLNPAIDKEFALYGLR